MKGIRDIVSGVALLGLLMFVGCSEDEVDPTYVESEYELDGKRFAIESNLFWTKSNEAGEEDQIRLIQETSPEGQKDMILFIPVQGSGRFEGSYIYSKTGDIRTYNVVYVKNIDLNDSFDWVTNGDKGSPLQIIRAGSQNGEPVYTITVEDFDLNYGFYDLLGDKWVSMGIKKFRFQYQGIIEKAR